MTTTWTPVNSTNNYSFRNCQLHTLIRNGKKCTQNIRDWRETEEKLEMRLKYRKNLEYWCWGHSTGKNFKIESVVGLIQNNPERKTFEWKNGLKSMRVDGIRWSFVQNAAIFVNIFQFGSTCWNCIGELCSLLLPSFQFSCVINP